MKKLLAALAILGSAIFTCVSAGPAIAAPDQVFVDPNVGVDSNPCTETSPCLTLQHALSVVADPGTVTILSSGTLAPVTITTGISITCPHGTCIIDGSANFNGAGTVAVTVNAPGKNVSLSGVSISGFGTGTTGVLVTDANQLRLNDVSVSGSGIGVSFTPSTAATNSHLIIQGSTIRQNTNRNVKIQPTSSSSASVLIRGSSLNHSNNDLLADATAGTGGVSVVVVNSFIGYASNSGINVVGNSQGGATARVLIDSSDLSFSSGTCIQSSNATAAVSLTKTQVTQCNTALSAAGGGIFTYGDNAINFNTSNGSTPTAAGGFR